MNKIVWPAKERHQKSASLKEGKEERVYCLFFLKTLA